MKSVMLGSVEPAMVLQAAETVRAALAAAPDDAWSARVPHLDWTVRETVAHTVRTAYFCGVDLAAGDLRMRAPEVVVDATAPPHQLLDALIGAARLTDHVLRAAAPDALGYDPDGPADATGFAAMCCAELLIHGWDAAQGLGVDLVVAAELASAVHARLFPELAAEADPWAVAAVGVRPDHVARPGKARRLDVARPPAVDALTATPAARGDSGGHSTVSGSTMRSWSARTPDRGHGRYLFDCSPCATTVFDSSRDTPAPTRSGGRPQSHSIGGGGLGRGRGGGCGQPGPVEKSRRRAGVRSGGSPPG